MLVRPPKINRKIKLLTKRRKVEVVLGLVPEKGTNQEETLTPIGTARTIIAAARQE